MRVSLSSLLLLAMRAEIDCLLSVSTAARGGPRRGRARVLPAAETRGTTLTDDPASDPLAVIRQWVLMVNTHDAADVLEALADGPSDLPSGETHFLRRLILEPALNRAQTKAHGKR